MSSRSVEAKRAHSIACLLEYALGEYMLAYGLMMRPGAVSGATRALRCLWHEVRDDERSNRYMLCLVRMLKKTSRSCYSGNPSLHLSVCPRTRDPVARYHLVSYVC
jgi:hypothetical protein